MSHKCPTCGWDTETTLCSDCYFWFCCCVVLVIAVIAVKCGGLS